MSGTQLPKKGISMDFIFIGAIVGFFALSVGLVRFCAALLNRGRQ